MELIIKPSILFLDEPTTGLDSSTANAVMTLLARYINTKVAWRFDGLSIISPDESLLQI
jgi:ABC-type Mn2+/Zn2+ transport system ATPase subunit